MSISAMKYALDVLDNYVEDPRCETHRATAVHFLEQAIAEAEKQPVHASDISQECVDKTAKHRHEPVAWREVAGKTTKYYDYNEEGRGEPLYAAPVAQCSYPKCQATNGCVGVCSKGHPDLARVGEVGVWGHKREWVGLTDEECTALFRASENLLDFCHAVESKLKEKNT